MEISKNSKQSQFKNLKPVTDKEHIKMVQVVMANLESWKMTGNFYFLSLAVNLIQDLCDEVA